MGRVLRGTLCLLAFSMIACSSQGADRPSRTRTDSLGVQIIHHSASFIHHSPVWEVEDPPVLSLGEADGPTELQFFGIRSAGVLPSEGVLIIDRGSRELRFFDATGRFEHSTGGPGEGPGEYVLPMRFWLREDTILVWDYGLRRLSILDGDGAFQKAVRPERLGRNAEVVSVFSDGTLLIKTFGLGEPGSRLGTTEIHLTLFNGGGEFLDSLQTHPLTVMERVSDTLVTGGALFSPSTSTAGGRRSFWIGYGDRPEIRHYSADGRLLQIVQWEQDPVEITQADEDRYYDELVEQADPGRRGMIEGLRGQQPLAEVFPYYDQLCSAPEDGVWVRTYRRPGEVKPHRWLLINNLGEILGRLNTPPGFEVLECGDEYVLGVGRDELDVERLVLYGLDTG